MHQNGYRYVFHLVYRHVNKQGLPSSVENTTLLYVDRTGGNSFEPPLEDPRYHTWKLKCGAGTSGPIGRGCRDCAALPEKVKSCER